MMLPLVWLNKSIVIINAPLQLLYIDEASKNVIKWDNIDWTRVAYPTRPVALATGRKPHPILSDSLQSMYVTALFVDF